mmetsp:Transcript_17016/g.54591  ORF Transcript_17016/g.54591 Transcript_17016/m.54591 type:complete len:363 (+) Transcript_17016:266-1354(+)
MPVPQPRNYASRMCRASPRVVRRARCSAPVGPLFCMPMARGPQCSSSTAGRSAASSRLGVPAPPGGNLPPAQGRGGTDHGHSRVDAREQGPNLRRLARLPSVPARRHLRHCHCRCRCRANPRDPTGQQGAPISVQVEGRARSGWRRDGRLRRSRRCAQRRSRARSPPRSPKTRSRRCRACSRRGGGADGDRRGLCPRRATPAPVSASHCAGQHSTLLTLLRRSGARGSRSQRGRAGANVTLPDLRSARVPAGQRHQAHRRLLRRCMRGGGGRDRGRGRGGVGRVQERLLCGAPTGPPRRPPRLRPQRLLPAASGQRVGRVLSDQQCCRWCCVCARHLRTSDAHAHCSWTSHCAGIYPAHCDR